MWAYSQNRKYLNLLGLSKWRLALANRKWFEWLSTAVNLFWPLWTYFVADLIAVTRQPYCICYWIELSWVVLRDKGLTNSISRWGDMSTKHRERAAGRGQLIIDAICQIDSAMSMKQAISFCLPVKCPSFKYFSSMRLYVY